MKGFILLLSLVLYSVTGLAQTLIYNPLTGGFQIVDGNGNVLNVQTAGVNGNMVVTTGVDGTYENNDVSATTLSFGESSNGARLVSAEDLFVRDENGNFVSFEEFHLKSHNGQNTINGSGADAAIDGNVTSASAFNFVSNPDGSRSLYAEDFFFRDADGNFINSRNITIGRRADGLTIVDANDASGAYKGNFGRADNVRFVDFQNGTRQLSAYNYYFQDQDGNFISGRNIDIIENPDSTTIALRDSFGTYENYNGAAGELTATQTDSGVTNIDASNFFVVDTSSGNFISAAELGYEGNDDRVAVNSVGLATNYDNNRLHAGTLNYENDTTLNTTRLNGTNLSFGLATGETGSANSFSFFRSSTETSLTSSGLRLTDGAYRFSSDTFNVNQNSDFLRADGTGIFVEGNGDFATAEEFQFINDRENEETSLDARGLTFGLASGETGSATTLVFHQSPDETSLDSTGLRLSDGTYRFSSDTFAIRDANGVITTEGSGVFVTGNGHGLGFGTVAGTYSGENGQFWGSNLSYSNAAFGGFKSDTFLLNRDGHLFSYTGTGFGAYDTQGRTFGAGTFEMNADTHLMLGTAVFNEVDFNIGQPSEEIPPEGEEEEDAIYGGGTASDLVINVDANENEIDATATDVEATILTLKAEDDPDRENDIRNDDFIETTIAADRVTYHADLEMGTTVVEGENVDINTGYGQQIHLNNGSITQFDGRSEVDLSFDGVVKSTDIPLTGEAEVGADIDKFAGYNVSMGQHSGSVSIYTAEDGGISSIYTKLGDQIKFEATDADGNARELHAGYHWDPENKRFLLEMRFIDGDEISIKVFPFKFESDQVNDDAIARLSAQLNSQNLEEYFDFVTGMLDFQQINQFLAVGPGQMKISLPIGGQNQGVEFIYRGQSQTFFGDERDRAKAFGVGFFRNTKAKGRNSAGIIVSADSSMTYEVEHGRLSIAGIPIRDKGEVPLTAGLYFNSVDAEGNAIFATAGVPIGSFDFAPTLGVGVKLNTGERSSLTLSAATNTGTGEVILGVQCNIMLQAAPTYNVSEAIRNMSSLERASTAAAWNREIKGY